MADQIEKKVLASLEVNSDGVQTSMSSLKTTIEAVATATKELQALTKQSATSFNGYSEALAKSKLSAQQNREEITRLNLAKKQEKDAIDKAKGSIIAAKGSYDEAQKSLTALGRAIKSAEGGFKSTDPAIQKQIADYKKLNSELTAFDKKLGNHQRNVGNYEGALSGLSAKINQLIPGFSQFQNILQGAARGFNVMGSATKTAGSAVAETGEAAEGAEASTLGLSGAAVGLTVGFAAVAAGAAGVIAYLKDISTFSDGVSNIWAGMKAQWVQFGNNIANNGFWKGFFESTQDAYNEAKLLNQAMIDLNRTMLASDVQTNKENQHIATQMLKMRNLHTTAKQAEDIFNDIQATAKKQFQRTSKEAEEGYNIVANKIKLNAGLTRDELTILAREGVEAAEKFKKEGKHISDELIADFAKFQMARTNAQAIQDQIDQRAQNREDQKIAKNKAADDKAEREREKAENDLLEAKRAAEELIQERGAALTKMLQDQQEAFARELSTTDEHYRQLIFKQQEFIIKQEELRNKTKSPAAKAQFTKNIAAAQGLIGTYKEGNAADIDKQVTDYYRKQAEAIQKGQEELAALQIGNIQDVNRRELALLDQRQENEQAAYKKEQDLLAENVNRLQNEVKTARGAELAALKADLDQQLTLQGINQDKSLASLKSYELARKEAIKRASDEELELRDQTAVLKAKFNNASGTNESGVLAAEQKQLLDQYNIEVSQKGLTDAKKLELEQKYLNDKQALDQQYTKKQQAYEIEIAQTVANGAFQILEQSLARSAQANELYLNRQKEHDLQNRSLTETQKYEVQEKYRILAGKQKVKEFKQEQAIALAKGAIDTAAAILKASPNVPLMVLAGITGAIQEGIIAAQRAPAYAKGGMHSYKSDGKGGVLPGYSKTDNTNAYLRSGEAVVVSEAMRDPWAKSVVSAINQAYGGRAFDSTVPVGWVKPGFAAGGVFNNYLPTGDNGLRPSISTGSSR
ncbi:MAG TPA: hypothetical protein VN922_24575, partial [Bacteroidia bacterium]|nr:hypothetical protein [Bacteroidia bacterium]